MKRFLSLASGSLIAAGLVALPVASFAQTATDASKTQTPAVTTPSANPVATPGATVSTTQAPVSKSTEATKKEATVTHEAKPGLTSKSDIKTPAHPKPDVHGLNTAKPHDSTAKAQGAE